MILKFSKVFALAAMALTGALSVNATDIEFTANNAQGAFPLVSDSGVAAAIVTDAADYQVVGAVAEMLASDIEAVTGAKPLVTNSLSSSKLAVIGGTLGLSPMVDNLAAAGKIATADLKGKWESYALQLVDNPVDGIDQALVVVGSTPRGTAYGLLEISRLIGVSPYIWWADVKPETRPALYAYGDRTLVGEPSVKYRGIFINDEDWGLQPWAAKGLDKKYNNIGPNTYARVMELLLRLRANTLWPAMHLCSEAFWANKDNLPVAKKYDIVLGSSHCEQMLRDNEWEWRRYDNGTYEDWDYPSNKTKIQRYWEERVIESKGYDAMYTLGMRGVHDWAISGYPTVQDKVNGLTEIISFQRSLLEKHIGDPTAVPQIFIPYKEVLEAYNAGLQVPEDVTLTWVDDNHGYIRQMPRAHEQARSGGNGIYYHISYWGGPEDYLWICSTAPALISYELTKGYLNGIQDLWVINVGDIKPAEAELQFSMDLAWDIERWQPANAAKYMRQWASETFGEEFADDIADIKEAYYRLASAGKPEHVFLVDYTNAQKDARIAEYAAIVDKVDALKAAMPARLADAYFQLIEYPVKGAYYMNVKTLRAKQSIQLAAAGQAEAALEYAAEARRAYRMIELMTQAYNNDIAGGKWNGMMNFKPRDRVQFNMPETATSSSIAPYVTEITEQEQIVVPATAYTSAKGSFKTFDGLGVNEAAVTVWPIDITAYSASQIANAPAVTYTVPVKAGKNVISARFLPTFPLNTDYDLRVALAINNGTPQVTSLKTVAMEGKWNTTVIRGYNDATVEYTADADGEVNVTVSMLDPGAVLCDICNTLPETIDLSLTEKLIKNYDFEIRRDGTPNPAGNIDRGIPFGWQSKGSLKLGNNGLQSYGINQDAANLHGKNVCWINSVPMPSEFELYQTIPAAQIEPGLYRVSCMLWVEENKKTTCRLFANNNVQYYGSESDYTNVLIPGETATYAGYAGQNGAGPFNLMPMTVFVEVAEGQDLTLGIRSSNRRNNGGAATDNAGWFKVDFFRIDRVSDLPQSSGEDLSLTESLIVNHDFELYKSGERVIENTSGDTRRGTTYGIYGWNILGSRFPGDSYGINKDANNHHGHNVCWFQPKDGYMPADFELSQTIPADRIEPGRYMVNCLLWAEEGLLSTVSLFANNNVQYYGMDFDYDLNLNPTANNTFAGYVGGTNGVFNLQDMSVCVDVMAGDDLTFGIRSSNIKADGTPSTTYKNGWFKTDYFRIHRLGALDAVDLLPADISAHPAVLYDLSGRRVTNNPEHGLYIRVSGTDVQKVRL